MSRQICRDKKVGEGTKKYGTFYKDYTIESDIMMRAGAMASALIIFFECKSHESHGSFFVNSFY